MLPITSRSAYTACPKQFLLTPAKFANPFAPQEDSPANLAMNHPHVHALRNMHLNILRLSICFYSRATLVRAYPG